MAAGIEISQHIRFGDIDSYHHVNNVVYLQYLEDARVQLIHTPLPDGGNLGDLMDQDLFTLVGRHEIEYLAPLRFRPEPVFVNIWVTYVGGSSFDFGYTVAEADSKVIYVQAATSMVLVSRSTGRPIRLTDPQRAALETWRGAPVAFKRAAARTASQNQNQNQNQNTEGN